MIQTTRSGSDHPPAGAVTGVRFSVRTSALDEVCQSLQRAVEQGRQLLDHPGVVRGRAHDVGDDELREATLLLASRWDDGLHALVADAQTLLTRLRTATDLYGEIERTVVPAVTHPLVPR